MSISSICRYALRKKLGRPDERQLDLPFFDNQSAGIRPCGHDYRPAIQETHEIIKNGSDFACGSAQSRDDGEDGAPVAATRAAAQ